MSTTMDPFLRDAWAKLETQLRNGRARLDSKPAGKSHQGEECKPGWSAARTGCTPTEEQAGAERKEIAGKTDKWVEQLKRGTGQLGAKDQAALEQGIAGTGLFSADEAKALVRNAAGGGKASDVLVAAVKAGKLALSIAHATNALPMAAKQVALKAGWSEATASRAATVASLVDWVTHGGASVAVMLAATATKPTAPISAIVDGVKNLIKNRKGSVATKKAAEGARAKEGGK